MLNYPLYFSLNESFAYGGSMKEFSQKLKDIKNGFKDHTVLGNFIDNHDQNRFLFNNKNIPTLKNAVVFCLFTEGIPIVYYGTEQYFNGGGDPGAREPLFNFLDKTSDGYKFFQAVIKARKDNEVINFSKLIFLDLGFRSRNSNL